MKKINYLLFTSVLYFLLMGNVFANSYSKTFTDVGTTCDDFSCDIPAYTITINSNDLDNVDNIRAYSPSSWDTYVDNEYQVYLEMFYEYRLYNNQYEEVKSFDGEIEILIKDNFANLVEGEEYNVYYFSFDYPRQLDKNNIGDRAKVVKINGELYIKLVTDTLKPFGLEKDISDEYKEEFRKISKNGYYIFPAVKPTQTIDDGFDFYTFFGAISKRNLPYNMWPADEFKLENDFQYMTLEFDALPGEIHVVKYKWQEQEVPKHLKKEIKDIEKNILKSTKPLSNFGGAGDGVYFEIEDLNFVNYIYNNYKGLNEAVIPYSSDIKRIFNYNNFIYHFDFRAGNPTPFYNIMFGYLLIEKDGLLYSTLLTTGVAMKPVIYIPEKTKDNDQAYMDAAAKRIKEYLQIDNVTIKVAGKRSELEKEYLDLVDAWSKIYNEDKLVDNYYTININGNEVDFVIEKNDKMAKEMEFKTKDLDSNVEINTTSGLVPHDTSIEVEIIGKNHKEYNKILEAIMKDDADIYDLKLFSESKNQYITKLPNGKFKVRIPLKDEYKNKELKVYYVDDNGDIEIYDVIVENGYAVFETTHFSTYSLVAEGDLVNPNTLDNINLFYIIGTISLMGIISSIVIMKKRYN